MVACLSCAASFLQGNAEIATSVPQSGRQRLWPREAVDQSLLDPTTHPDQADMGD